MSQSDKKNWGSFILVWLLSGLLQFFFFYFLFFKTPSTQNILGMGATHLSAALIYFLLKRDSSRKQVWPLQFFFLTFFTPGVSFIFLPFLWAQELKGNLNNFSFEEEGLELNPILYEKKLSPQEKMREGLDIAPYADILAGQDMDLKRGAIERMVELKNKESVQLLEKYRSDDSSELRFYILSALHRIRQDFEEELAAAKKEMQINLYKISARIYLAKVYLQYIQSGLLDPNTQNNYFEEATQNLRYCLNSGYSNTHAFEVFLELLIFKKDYVFALQLLEEASIKKWCSADFYFQKKSELLYSLKDYLELRIFILNFPPTQLKSSESTQIYYAWGGEVYESA